MIYDLTAEQRPEREGRSQRLPAASAYILLTTVVAAGFITWAIANFGKLFPLIEYRQWSVPANASVIGTLFSIKSIEFSRSFGLFTDAALAILFGHNIWLHNGFQICLLAASGVLCSMTLRRLFPTAPSALLAVAMVFTLFSTAVVDSLVWQATILDKLCLFFSWLATYALVRVNLQRISVTTLGITNLTIFVLVVAAYNSKESAFGLVPSLLLLAIARGVGKTFTIRALLISTRNSIAYLAMPTVYAIVHVSIVLHNRFFVDSVGRAHELSGALDFHLYHYFIYLFNLENTAGQWHLWPSAPSSVLETFQIAAVAAIALFGVIVYNLGDRYIFAMWLWALLSFIMSLSVSLHAAGFPAYYLLVPEFYLIALAFITSIVLWKFAEGNKARVGISAAIALITIAYLIGFAQTLPQYMRIVRMSNNFSVALAQLNLRITQKTLPGRVIFYWPQTESKAYMFLGPTNNRQIAPYAEPRWPTDAAAALDRSILDRPYLVGPKLRVQSGVVSIVLGNELQVQAIVGAPR